mmetsp:Transcript_11901/g.34338  ORF Transcript_11901/g.34338 Transcript_11901/m.34338 type:complete len:229 (+) Transcript_11901:1090-1776(+)
MSQQKVDNYHRSSPHAAGPLRLISIAIDSSWGVAAFHFKIIAASVATVGMIASQPSREMDGILTENRRVNKCRTNGSLIMAAAKHLPCSGHSCRISTSHYYHNEQDRNLLLLPRGPFRDRGMIMTIISSTTRRNEVVRNLMLLLILILGMGRHRGRATGMLPTWHLDTAGNNVLGEPERNPLQQQPAREEDAKHQNGIQLRANKLRTQSWLFLNTHHSQVSSFIESNS